MTLVNFLKRNELSVKILGAVNSYIFFGGGGGVRAVFVTFLVGPVASNGVIVPFVLGGPVTSSKLIVTFLKASYEERVNQYIFYGQ